MLKTQKTKDFFNGLFNEALDISEVEGYFMMSGDPSEFKNFQERERFIKESEEKLKALLDGKKILFLLEYLDSSVKEEQLHGYLFKLFKNTAFRFFCKNLLVSSAEDCLSRSLYKIIEKLFTKMVLVNLDSKAGDIETGKRNIFLVAEKVFNRECYSSSLIDAVLAKILVNRPETSQIIYKIVDQISLSQPENISCEAHKLLFNNVLLESKNLERENVFKMFQMGVCYRDRLDKDLFDSEIIGFILRNLSNLNEEQLSQELSMCIGYIGIISRHKKHNPDLMEKFINELIKRDANGFQSANTIKYIPFQNEQLSLRLLEHSLVLQNDDCFLNNAEAFLSKKVNLLLQGYEYIFAEAEKRNLRDKIREPVFRSLEKAEMSCVKACIQNSMNEALKRIKQSLENENFETVIESLKEFYSHIFLVTEGFLKEHIRIDRTVFTGNPFLYDEMEFMVQCFVPLVSGSSRQLSNNDGFKSNFDYKIIQKFSTGLSRLLTSSIFESNISETLKMERLIMCKEVFSLSELSSDCSEAFSRIIGLRLGYLDAFEVFQRDIEEETDSISDIADYSGIFF